MSITLTRATGTVEFCTDMAKQAEWEALQAHIRVDREGSPTKDMLVDTAALEASAAIPALEAEMAASTYVFTLQALPRKVWAEMVAAHPPREDNDTDDQYDVNLSTFPDAALSLARPADGLTSIVSVRRKSDGERVDFDPATDWQPLADEMSDGQWTAFSLKLFALNRGAMRSPFSSAASQLNQRSGQTSS